MRVAPAVPGARSVAGVVLAGGSSTRMGRDKALVTVGDASLVQIAARALVDGGVDPVLVIGGDAPAMGALGLPVEPDDHPGEGPLGAILTALRVTAGDVVVVLACDMPEVDGSVVRALVDALAAQPSAMVATATMDGRRQVLTAAYRQAVAVTLETAFRAGERSPRRALAGLPVVEVDGLDPSLLADVDRPGDLRRYARPDTPIG